MGAMTSRLGSMQGPMRTGVNSGFIWVPHSLESLSTIPISG